ncbi:MAG: aminopeptidase P N-terminal domain-containing protein [Bacteroidales bacterium]
MKYEKIPPELFVKNRNKLFNKMEVGELAILCSNNNYPRNGDQNYPFRQDSDFFWLTGINQDWTCLMMYKDKQKQNHSLLLTKETNERIRLWDGPRLDKKEAAEISGIDDVIWLNEIDKSIKHYLNKAKKVSMNEKANQHLLNDKESGSEMLKKHFAKYFGNKKVHNICPRIHPLRVIKEKEEIDLIRKAIEITRHAYDSVLRQLKPGMKEYQAEAIMRYEILSRGADDMSFAPILASGENACILHYINNDKTCHEGELLLMDFGAEYALYPADCSRTIPVNGKFSERQKTIYQAVLDVYYQAIELFKPGETIRSINEKTGLLMQEKLLELGILSENDIRNEDKNHPAYKKYFPHGTSHFIGLDVHDVGDKDRAFEPGMVMSCEPGIYLQKEGIGVRIETDILITETGAEDLMADFPVEIKDIEKQMTG